MPAGFTCQRRGAAVSLIVDETTEAWIRRETAYFFKLIDVEGADWRLYSAPSLAPVLDWRRYSRAGPHGSGCDFLVAADARAIVIDHPSSAWRAIYVLRMLRNLLRWQLAGTGAVFVHGSALSRAGGAVALIGPPRCGKSSLMASGLSQGWAYLSEDDLTLLDTGDERIRALGWPGSLRIRRDRLGHYPRLKDAEAGLSHPANEIERALPWDRSLVRVLPSEIALIFGIEPTAEHDLQAVLRPSWGCPDLEALAPAELTAELLSAWDVLPERKAGTRAVLRPDLWGSQVFDPFLIEMFPPPDLSAAERLLRRVGASVPGSACHHEGCLPRLSI